MGLPTLGWLGGSVWGGSPMPVPWSVRVRDSKEVTLKEFTWLPCKKSAGGWNSSKSSRDTIYVLNAKHWGCKKNRQVLAQEKSCKNIGPMRVLPCATTCACSRPWPRPKLVRFVRAQGSPNSGLSISATDHLGGMVRGAWSSGFFRG